MIVEKVTDCMIVEKVTDCMIIEAVTDGLIIEKVTDGLIIEVVNDCEIVVMMNDCDIDSGGENVPAAAGGAITSTIGLVHFFGRARLPATTPLPATTVWIA
jgi:pyruvate/2-oxoglutarate/acetoin dehydrogenase E1 component